MPDTLGLGSAAAAGVLRRCRLGPAAFAVFLAAFTFLPAGTGSAQPGRVAADLTTTTSTEATTTTEPTAEDTTTEATVTTTETAPVVVTTVQVTTEATTTGVSPGGAAVVGAAAANQESSTQWGWIAFGILAAAVIVFGIVWWVRRPRHA